TRITRTWKSPRERARVCPVAAVTESAALAEPLTLVASPALGFAALAAALGALAWSREEGSPATAPILIGEPEIATFARAGSRVVYTFDPVLRLRVLVLHGADAVERASEIGERVALLSAAELRA